MIQHRILELILKGLSPNEAAIQAGFRKKIITLPIDPEAAARVLRRHFQGEVMERLLLDKTSSFMDR